MAAVKGYCKPARNRVGITGVEPVGNYALRLMFDDGHNTGLYSWSLLRELGRNARQELVPVPGTVRRHRHPAPLMGPVAADRSWTRQKGPPGSRARNNAAVGYNEERESP